MKYLIDPECIAVKNERTVMRKLLSQSLDDCQTLITDTFGLVNVLGEEAPVDLVMKIYWHQAEIHGRRACVDQILADGKISSSSPQWLCDKAVEHLSSAVKSLVAALEVLQIRQTVSMGTRISAVRSWVRQRVAGT